MSKWAHLLPITRCRTRRAQYLEEQHRRERERRTFLFFTHPWKGFFFLLLFFEARLPLFINPHTHRPCLMTTCCIYKMNRGYSVLLPLYCLFFLCSSLPRLRFSVIYMYHTMIYVVNILFYTSYLTQLNYLIIQICCQWIPYIQIPTPAPAIYSQPWSWRLMINVMIQSDWNIICREYSCTVRLCSTANKANSILLLLLYRENTHSISLW